MLSSVERRELARHLKLYERGLLTEDETAARLARVARRGDLDVVLAEVPSALVGPLRKCIEAGLPPQPYSPASLPPVSSVDVVVLDSQATVSRFDEFLSLASVRHVSLTGEDAESIASLWLRLPPDEQARCHNPPYGLRFRCGPGMVCEASICWRCNNIYGRADGEDLAYEFDGEAPVSSRLLAAIRQAVGEPSTT